MLAQIIARQESASVKTALVAEGLEVCTFDCLCWTAPEVSDTPAQCEVLYLLSGKLQLELKTGELLCAERHELLLLTPLTCVRCAHMLRGPLRGAVVTFDDVCALKSLPWLWAGQPERVGGAGQSGQKHTYRDQYQIESIRRVQAFMMEHLDQPLTIDSLARAFHISGTLLKEGFRQMYGLPVRKFLQVHRMARAAELLCTTNQPIAQVASAVGYESVSQFGMVFKRQYRMTPSQYRRQFRRKMSKTGELCLNPNVLP